MVHLQRKATLLFSFLSPFSKGEGGGGGGGGEVQLLKEKKITPLGAFWKGYVVQGCNQEAAEVVSLLILN